MLLKKMIGYLFFPLMAILFATSISSALTEIATEEERQNAPKVSPQYAHQELVSGKALLVCAYPDVEVCEKVMIKGAIPLKEFEAKLPKIKKDQEIIFYCA